MFESILKIKPLSVNEAWQGRRYRSPKYKTFQKDVLICLPRTNYRFDGILRVELVFGFSSVLSDIDNPIKMVLDILQLKYNFNDSQIYELNVRKTIVKKGDEFIYIAIGNTKE